MSQNPFEFEEETEAIYESLISLIENSQGQLAPIVVGCDEVRLRERVIERYERDAKSAKVQPYRVLLGTEPSLRAGLAEVVEREVYLQEGGEAVFTVLGANTLLWVKLRDEDTQSEIEKFYGYLQWTREGLREFRYPIVLWVSIRILREMGRRAPDFWSWRKASFQIGTEDQRLAEINREPIEASRSVTEDEPLPPLDELLQELEELKARSPDSPNLPTLYSKIGQVYERQIERGESKDLESDRSAAIDYFEKAIEGMRAIGNDQGEVDNLLDLGSLLIQQSRFPDGIEILQKSLEISEKKNFISGVYSSLALLGNSYYYLGDHHKAINYGLPALRIAQESGEVRCVSRELHNLGNYYGSLRNQQKAIEYYSQAIEIKKVIGDRGGEAAVLSALGNSYFTLGQYQKSIDCQEEALPILKEFKNCFFEQDSLMSLGQAYTALGMPQRAMDYYRKALDIAQTIGDRRNEAYCLYWMAEAIAKLDRHVDALGTYQKAQAIFEEIPMEHSVQECKDAIRNLNKIIPVQSTTFPDIPKRKKKSMSREDRICLGVVVGVVLVVLVWYLRR
jgi:tetratricopeptide (TPR) repeat protein